MSPRIYQLPLSLYSFKVRLAAHIKELEIALLEPPGGTYRSAAYRELVPIGTIPALIDGPLVLTESDAIIEYLDDRYGGRLLVAGVPARKARIRMLSRCNDLYLEPLVRSLFAHVSPRTRDPLHVQNVIEQLAEKLALVELAIDTDGPLTIDREPTMADCGLAATLTWLLQIAPVLLPNLMLGPRLARVYTALSGASLTAEPIEDYRLLVEAWVATKVSETA